MGLGRLFVGALLLAGAAGAEELPPPQVSGVPIPEGQIEKAIAGVDGLVAAVMAATGVPGVAVAVVHDGEVALVKGYGVREAGKPEPVDGDTVFQIASVSKSVGATVVAREVGKSVVRWDTPVTDLLPWFALADPRATAMLTIGDLYAHRSGLPDHAGDDLEDIGYDRRAILERLRFLPLAGFRDSYAYTNNGPTAAAEAVATAAGTDWASLSETELYAPLGMTRTSSRFRDFMARDNRAVPHMRQGQGWAALAQRDPDPQSPAGGVSSSAADMAKWMRLVLGNGSFEGAPLVDPKALLAALSPQSDASPPFAQDARPGPYGFGFGVGVTAAGRVGFSHSGGFNLGAGTTFQMLPSVGVGIVVLSNAQPIGAVEAIGLSFMDLVQFGRVTRDWYAAVAPRMAPMFAPVGKLAGQAPPADPAPARAFADYTGTYRNDYFGKVEVVAMGNELILKAGPGPMAFPLRHWSGDSFVFEPWNENNPSGSVAEVSFAPGSPAPTLTVDTWNEHGLGTFTR